MKSSFIQMKRLSDKKSLGKPIHRKNSATNFFKDKNLQIKPPLRRIESASLLKKNINADLPQIQQRYRLLEQSYKKMLFQAQNKSQVFRKQKEAVERLRKIVEKDQNQIHQLKGMLKIKKKKNQIAQTQPEGSLFIRMTTQDKNRVISSTGQSEVTSQTQGEERYSSIKSSEKRKSKIFQKIQLQNRKLTEQPLSPLSKRFRFVPTLPLN